MHRRTFLHDEKYNNLSCEQFNLRNRINGLKGQLVASDSEEIELNLSDTINALEVELRAIDEELAKRENELAKIKEIERASQLKTRNNRAEY